MGAAPQRRRGGEIELSQIAEALESARVNQDFLARRRILETAPVAHEPVRYQTRCL